MVLCQVGRVGQKAFADYASPRFHIVNQSTGEVCNAVFVGVLAASNYTFADVPEKGACDPTIHAYLLCQLNWVTLIRYVSQGISPLVRHRWRISQMDEESGMPNGGGTGPQDKDMRAFEEAYLVRLEMIGD